MGVWGAGLYSGDFAMDLRGAAGAVARLPLDGDKLLELLCGLEASAANDPENEDHTAFWLVVADQFAKRGIDSKHARARALRIIDDGSDIAMLGKLGMDAAGLKKREKALAALRRELTNAPPAAERRTVLRKPQPLVMGVGDVFVYPTSRGRCRNLLPEWVRVAPEWVQDGWNAAVIVSAERAFDFLAWYRALTLARPVAEKPDLARLGSAQGWVLKAPGTCTGLELKRLGMEKLGAVRVDGEKLLAAFGELPSGANAAIHNRPIERELSLAGARLGEALISERALQKSPGGLNKLPELIREAAGRYERMHANGERVGRLAGRQEPAISRLDAILG